MMQKRPHYLGCEWEISKRETSERNILGSLIERFRGPCYPAKKCNQATKKKHLDDGLGLAVKESRNIIQITCTILLTSNNHVTITAIANLNKKE